MSRRSTAARPALLAISRGHRMLAGCWVVWLALATTGTVGVLFLVHTPPTAPVRAGVIVVWTFQLVTIALSWRTGVGIDGDRLVVRGRLRTFTIELADVCQLASERSGDLWSTFAFPGPLMVDEPCTVAVVLWDGRRRDLAPIVGSRRACSRLAVELDRQLGR